MYFPSLTLPAILLGLSSLLPAPAAAQHYGAVGPLTTLAEKDFVCDVTCYGAVADNVTDIGPAITDAFNECVLKNPGSTLYIPPGTYSLASTVTLNKGSGYAFQLDGLIIASYAGTISGNMIVFENAVDLEVFSSNGLGAIQGQGYVWRNSVGLSVSKPRIMRFTTCTNFAVHDLILVDAPQFHLIVGGSAFEVYDITVRGPSVGGSDGIDASGTNYWIHDIDISNRDECVSVKSPSVNATIENAHCNQSGGMSIGSLSGDVVIENIYYNNIDAYECTEGLMIKTWPSPAGSAVGYAKNIVANNFRLYKSTYSAYITQYWDETDMADGAGIQLSNITFSNWSGSNLDGYERGAVVVVGSEYAPAYDINFVDFSMYTETVSDSIGELNRCSNVYGTGACVATATSGSYPAGVSATQTVKTAPNGWISPTPFAWGVAPYPVYAEIPVYDPVPSWPLVF